MTGNRILLDTNIIVYLLSGDKTLAELLNEKTVYVSFVTELELLSYPKLSVKEKNHIIAFLNQCLIVDINKEIKSEAISLRQKNNLRLPDSIILATAQYLGIPLISSDKILSQVKDVDLILYEHQ